MLTENTGTAVRLTLFLLVATLTAGCGMNGMTTQQVVEKLSECEKAGLHADVYRLFGDSKVVDIQCVPNTEKKGL